MRLTGHLRELAANAVRHGAGRGRLRLRADGAFLYCQVSDDGPARLGDQQPAGTAPWRREHGHGPWLVDQVADQFSIDHGPAGTTVTAAFALGSPPGPDQPGTEQR
jgi:anti-sigma regulatory factor (Ser/Thr protein kinase)